MNTQNPLFKAIDILIKEMKTTEIMATKHTSHPINLPNSEDIQNQAKLGVAKTIVKGFCGNYNPLFKESPISKSNPLNDGQDAIEKEFNLFKKEENSFFTLKRLGKRDTTIFYSLLENYCVNISESLHFKNHIVCLVNIEEETLKKVYDLVQLFFTPNLDEIYQSNLNVK